MSYKEAARGSKEQTYIVCPLCARNRIIEAERKGRLRWDFWDPATSAFVQIREAEGKLRWSLQDHEEPLKRGGAKAGGFPIKEVFTWEEAKAKFPDQVEAVREQLKRILVLLAEDIEVARAPLQKEILSITEKVIAEWQTTLDDGKKSASLGKLESKIGDVEEDVVEGIGDLRSAIDDYRDIKRAGMAPEDYALEKEEAWEAIREALDALQLVEPDVD